MPTLRPRFQVTETPEVERALRLAAERWPEVSRSELVLRLFATAADELDAERTQRREQRLAAVDFSAGSLDVAYEPGYLETLRSEWPE
jgi:hypothetical protein